MALNYELRRANHAIGEFSAAVHFFQPISGATFSAACEALRSIAAELDLPAPVAQPMFQFTIGPDGLTQGGGGSGASGFQRFTKEGEVAESISCDPISITYVLRDYTVWEDVLPKLVDLFSRLALIYVREVPAIVSIRLQYINEFRSKSKDITVASELFKDNSQWVAPLSTSGREFWHSHVGVYIPHNAEERYLVNVNCDIASTVEPLIDEKRTIAKVLVLSGVYFNVPGEKPLIVPPEELAPILEEKLTAAHSLEKKVLREVVAEPYLKAMGANDAD